MRGRLHTEVTPRHRIAQQRGQGEPPRARVDVVDGGEAGLLESLHGGRGIVGPFDADGGNPDVVEAGVQTLEKDGRRPGLG